MSLLQVKLNQRLLFCELKNVITKENLIKDLVYQIFHQILIIDKIDKYFTLIL